MSSDQGVLLILSYAGSRHRFKFFRGTSQAELLQYIEELLDLPSGARFQLLDSSGDPVLLNSCIPSALELHVELLDAKRRKVAHHTEQYLLDVARASRCTRSTTEGELLPLLSCAERLSKAAGLARRRVLDDLGTVQAQRSVFRSDTPIHVRQIMFEFCSAVRLVRCAEVCRAFLGWATWEGRRIFPIVEDCMLRGGVESAKKLGNRVHPSFLRSVKSRHESEAAVVFLETILKQEGKPLSSLIKVHVANTQYLPATLLIRLLKKAGGLKNVNVLIRLDRPLPPECLRSVRNLKTLVLHATELHGFPSLFAGGPSAVLRHVIIRDTVQLDIDRLLGALPSTCASGAAVEHLEIVPHGVEPPGRRWEHWIGPSAELLEHPALATVKRVTLPVSCNMEVAVACAEAIYNGLKIERVPRCLKSLRLLPYRSESSYFSPDGASANRMFYNSDLKLRIDTLLENWNTKCPRITIVLPGVGSVDEYDQTAEESDDQEEEWEEEFEQEVDDSLY